MMDIQAGIELMQAAVLTGMIIALSGQFGLMGPVRTVVGYTTTLKVATYFWMLAKVGIPAFCLTKPIGSRSVGPTTRQLIRYTAVQAYQRNGGLATLENGLPAASVGKLGAGFRAMGKAFVTLSSNGTIAGHRAKFISSTRFSQLAGVYIKRLATDIADILFSVSMPIMRVFSTIKDHLEASFLASQAAIKVLGFIDFKRPPEYDLPTIRAKNLNTITFQVSLRFNASMLITAYGEFHV